jgi:hypothetical protein
VQVVGAAWRGATKIVPGVGDLVQRTGDDRTDRILDGRTIGRSGDTVWPVMTDFPGLASKPVASGFLV